MKNSMKSIFLTTAAFVFGTISVQAQSIEMGELGSASAYDPGTLSAVDGGLGSGLWSGTEATTAVRLIKNVPSDFNHPLARTLTRSALLSAGATPTGSDQDAFQTARLDAIIRIADMAAAQDIIARTPSFASDQQLDADLALTAGDITRACSISDQITQARSESYWMKLRAFCHVERGETAAAEITLDLLGSSGNTDKTYGALMRYLMKFPGTPSLNDINSTPLNMAMMAKSGLSWPSGKTPATLSAGIAMDSMSDPETRLKALMQAANALSDNQISEILNALGTDNMTANELAGGIEVMQSTGPNLDAALSSRSAKSFAQLFRIARENFGEDQLRAVTALLIRADQAGQFERFAQLLKPQLQAVSFDQLSPEMQPIISRAAVTRGDVIALQRIHTALSGQPDKQNRIALAADALGNGFFGGGLGTDIDKRLSSPSTRTRAIRDALLAHALGANLSDPALAALESKAALGSLSGEMMALKAASKRRAQAETALRAAQLLDDNMSDTKIYMITAALYDAGLTDQAAKLAAQDFLSGS